MANYPTHDEILSNLTADELTALVDKLPSYHTAPVTLVKLDLPTVTPYIMSAYASLIEAVQAEYPTATATPGEITRPQTRAELEEHAVQSEQSRVYDERRKAEQADTK